MPQIKRQPTPAAPGRCRIYIGKGIRVIVDPNLYDDLKRYRWFALRSHSITYAVRRVIRNGKAHYIRMHRQITNCPKGMVVHHMNGNPHDNRLRNLRNVTPEEHRYLQKYS